MFHTIINPGSLLSTRNETCNSRQPWSEFRQGKKTKEGIKDNANENFITSCDSCVGGKYWKLSQNKLNVEMCLHFHHDTLKILFGTIKREIYKADKRWATNVWLSPSCLTSIHHAHVVQHCFFCTLIHSNENALCWLEYSSSQPDNSFQLLSAARVVMFSP